MAGDQRGVGLMKAQEIFDTVARHLFKQGHQAMRTITVGGDVSKQECAYRGDNGDMCAFGVVVPDECYSPDMEGLSVLPAIERMQHPPQWMKDNLGLLEMLQGTHDDTESWSDDENMREALWSVANSFGLDPVILNSLSFGRDAA
jgi:hypothetical protein